MKESKRKRIKERAKDRGQKIEDKLNKAKDRGQMEAGK